jgi:hypothetical protein
MAGKNLDGQFAAAFCAAALYDILAGSGFCPLSKAVRPGALPLFWIICK